MKWFSILLCAWLLLSPMVSANAAPQPPRRDPGMLRQIINGDPADYYLAQPGQVPESLQPQTNRVLPTWSRLAFQSYRNNNWDIYLADPLGANESRLTGNTSVEADPSLVKGGSLVAFDSNRSGNYEIYTQNADGSNVKKLAANSASDTVPVFSPDGGRIVFQSTRTGNSDLFVMNQDGSGLTQITNSPAYDGEATWSPDGSQIAFVSKRGGYYDVWVMNADGANPLQLTHGASAATPSWSPKGDKIAYSNDGDGDGYYELWWMNPDGSSPLQRLDEPTTRDYWGESWSPDGKFIALIATDWIYYQNKWYWWHSYLQLFDPYEAGYVAPGTSDDLVMRVSWASTDDTPPDPCTINLFKESQAWDSFPVSWASADAESGVASYDVQVRPVSGGTWQDFLVNTSQTGGVYQGADGQQDEFRCRAMDLAGNERAWDTAPINSIVVHSSRPISMAHVSQRYAEGPVEVSWTGSDANGGIGSYDIFVRDGENGNWIAWLSGVTKTAAAYNGTAGHTYYFRSQAHDLDGHTQVWQPDPQAAVTFYDASFTVQASDTRGNALPVPSITLAPAALASELSQTSFVKRFDLQATAEPVKVSIAAPGFGSIPDNQMVITNDSAFTYVLPPVDDQVTNGGFETGDLTGWNPTGGGVSVTATPHTGQYAASLVPGTGGASAFSQVVTIPATTVNPTLSFMYYLSDFANGDQFTVKVNGDHELVVLDTAAVTPHLTHAWADLSAFVGQTITLSFQIAGTAAGVVVDEVSLGSWSVPQIKTVSPESWQTAEPQTITISGQNFASLPQVYLNDVPLTGVEWVDSTQITAQTPPDMLGGHYRLRVVNPDGVENELADPLALQPLPVYLPRVFRQDSSMTPALSDWPTLGNDAQHSGYSPNAASVSRYSQIWSNIPIKSQVKIKQVVAADGIVVVVAGETFKTSGVFAYDIGTGRELWNYMFTDQWSVDPASIAYGRVYFEENTQSSAYLFCLDLYTGQKLWQGLITAQFDDYMHPLVVGQNVYVKGGYTGGLYSFNAVTGAQLSFVSLMWAQGWAPAYADGKIYTRADQMFSEHNPDDNSINWSLYVDSPFWTYGTSISPVIANRTAFITGTSALTAINLDAHAVSWKINGKFTDTMPAVASNLIYDINVNALEVRSASTGELLNSYTTQTVFLHGPLITPTAIYIATDSDTYMLDRSTLQVVWSAPEGGWLTVADGYLFIARPDGCVSAYRAQEP